MSTPLNTFAPNTIIKSQPANDNFLGLSTGTMDADSNSLALARKYGMYNFAAYGLTIGTSSSLASTIASGVAFINANYIAITNTVKTFSASKDTYVDLKDDGTFAYVEVANGALTGMTLTTNSDGSEALRIAKVVTSSTAVTSVVQLGFDMLGNMFYRTSRVFIYPTADGTDVTYYNDNGQQINFGNSPTLYARGYTRVPSDIDTSYSTARITMRMYPVANTSATFTYYLAGFRDTYVGWNIVAAGSSASISFTTSTYNELNIDFSSATLVKEGMFAFVIKPVGNTQNLRIGSTVLEYRPKFGELR